MIPDTKVFHTKDLSAQIHSARLSFAKPEYMEKFLDITPGSVSVLGLMNDTENHVQLLIDEDVLNSEYVGSPLHQYFQPAPAHKRPGGNHFARHPP